MCGKVMSQNSLAKHQTNQCPKRPVSCQFCQQQMMHEQLEVTLGHNAIVLIACTFFIVLIN